MKNRNQIPLPRRLPLLVKRSKGTSNWDAFSHQPNNPTRAELVSVRDDLNIIDDGFRTSESDSMWFSRIALLDPVFRNIGDRFTQLDEAFAEQLQGAWCHIRRAAASDDSVAEGTLPGKRTGGRGYLQTQAIQPASEALQLLFTYAKQVADTIPRNLSEAEHLETYDSMRRTIADCLLEPPELDNPFSYVLEPR